MSIAGVVSAIAVDPRDGAIYVAALGEAGSKDVRKYDAGGHFLYNVDLPGNVSWLAVDDQGDVWVPGAFNGPRIHEYRFDDATQSATDLRTVGTVGSGPGQLNRLTGIDVDADGNVYVVDVGNHTVHVFGPDGQWRFDVGSAALFPGDARVSSWTTPTIACTWRTPRSARSRSSTSPAPTWRRSGRSVTATGRSWTGRASSRSPPTGTSGARTTLPGAWRSSPPPARSCSHSPTRRSRRTPPGWRLRAAWRSTARPATSSSPTTGTSACSASRRRAPYCRSSASAARSRRPA